MIWKDTDGKTKQNASDLYSIVHEIGYSLGLSHPNERPYSPTWDSSDTVMSYNPSKAGFNTTYSSADIAALQLIWGSGDGQKSGSKNQISLVGAVQASSKKCSELNAQMTWLVVVVTTTCLVWVVTMLS